MQLLSSLKRPSQVEFRQVERKAHLGTFKIKPYERGFGITVGNSLRRVLLSVMPGHAVVAVKLSDINNEFQNIPGVYEDTVELLANLKVLALGFKDANIKSKVYKFEFKGEGTFHAKDFLKKDSNLIVGNGDHKIFSHNKETNFTMDVQIERGRGYIDSELIQKHIEVAGAIPLDANYSPILNVQTKVHPLTVENASHYEELEISIETNGIIAPESALREAVQILKEAYLPFKDISSEPILTPVRADWDKKVKEKNTIFNESVYCIEFAVRTHFFLKVNEIKEIGQLVLKEEEDLRLKKHFNENILSDIQEKLEKKELHVGMKNIDYVEKASY